MIVQSLHSDMFRHDNAIFRERIPGLKPSIVKRTTCMKFTNVYERCTFCMKILFPGYVCILLLQALCFCFVGFCHELWLRHIYVGWLLLHILLKHIDVLVLCSHKVVNFINVVHFTVNDFKLGMLSLKMALSCRNMSG